MGGGFYFNTSHNITVEGLTVVNCGKRNKGVMYFDTVVNLFFLMNSIQHMKGYGLLVHNCINVLITNCSYYDSYFDPFVPFKLNMTHGGGVGIVYDTQYSNTGYTL